MKTNYEKLKAFYGHERSIHLDEMIAGTVYTPAWIAKQMIYYLLKNHITDKINAFEIESVNFDAIYINCYLNQNHLERFEADALLKIIKPLSILDLSCGSGVLLISYLEFIEFLSNYASQNTRAILSGLIHEKLYCVDIDSKAINVFREILNEFANSRNISLENLNVYCMNSLIDVLPFEGKKFDLIIGNPPYIGEKNNLEWFKPIKATTFGTTYYEGKMDYFYFFIYRGWELLKENGSLCYLSSNYFLTADGAKKLREFIKTSFNISSFVDYGDMRVFPERKLHACVYVLQKKISNEVLIYGSSLDLLKSLNTNRVFQQDGTMAFIISDEIQMVLTAMWDNKICTLGDVYDINQGIVSGSDKQFVYHDDDLPLLPDLIKKYLVPFYKNSDIKHYYASNNTPLHLLYIDKSDVSEPLINWLTPYKEKLMKRREVVKNIRKWYMLTWPRTRSLFTCEKIVAPQRAKDNRFAYVNTDFYASADVYYISSKGETPYSLPVLTLLLNSSIYYYWLSNMGKKKGSLLELYATPLKNIPLPKLKKSELIKMTAFAQEMFFKDENPSSNRLLEIQNEIDLIIRCSFNI